MIVYVIDETMFLNLKNMHKYMMGENNKSFIGDWNENPQGVYVIEQVLLAGWPFYR